MIQLRAVVRDWWPKGLVLLAQYLGRIPGQPHRAGRQQDPAINRLSSWSELAPCPSCEISPCADSRLMLPSPGRAEEAIPQQRMNRPKEASYDQYFGSLK